MILVLSMLLITIIVFASVFLCLFNRINDANGRIQVLEDLLEEKLNNSGGEE